MRDQRVILTLLMQEIGWATDPYFIDADKVAAILNQHVESQNQALQERAERAEHLLQAIAFDDQGKLQAWLQPLYIREPYVTVLVDKATQLLSPTQETEGDCLRCGNERTVGGYGNDERFPCPLCRPTQETDPE